MLQADGGTRTASITGACVALHIACQGLVKSGAIETNPVTELVAAISCGIYEGELVLDLDYPGGFQRPGRRQFPSSPKRAGSSRSRAPPKTGRSPRAQFVKLLDLARDGVTELVGHQRKALGIK